MTAFACLISDNTDEKLESKFTELSNNLVGYLQNFKTDILRTQNLVAVKHWLSHARTHSIAKDKNSNSWLACIGNPVSRRYTNTPNGNLAEQLLNDFIIEGKEAITSLSAPFVVIIYDGKNKTLNVVTDRLGLQYIYITKIANGYLLSTSSRALASIVDVHLNQKMLVSFFSTGHLMDNQTYYQEITKVKPACWLQINQGQCSETIYWKPPKSDPSYRRFDDAVDEFIQKQRDAIECRLDNDNRTSIELTGGLDSRLNLVLASKTSKPYHCWTIGERDGIDAIIADQLQKITTFSHHILSPRDELKDNFVNDLQLITNLTDGEANALNLIASPGCNRRSVQTREASISGLAGEILRGFYYISHKCLSDNSTVKINRVVNFHMTSNIGLRPAIFSNIFPVDHSDILTSMVAKSFDAYQNRGLHWLLDWFYYSVRTQFFSGRSCSFNNFFYRLQLPYFDNDVIDLAFRLPWKFKKNSMLLKKAIAKVNPQLADIILTTGLPARQMTVLDTPLLMNYYYKYAKKATSKIFGMITHKTGTKVAQDSFNEIVARKLKSKEMQSYFDYSEMASSFLYNPDTFSSFIKENHQNGFANRYQIGLILSFEILCRQLNKPLRV